MKNFFKKPHNILFTAAAALFLQFLGAVICFYAEAVIYSNFTGLSSYLYMAYCAAVCVFSAVFVLKDRGEGVNAVRMWFTGFFAYAFFEIAFYLKAQYLAAAGYSLMSEEVLGIWDNQPLYRLHLCAGVLCLIYFALYIFENTKNKKIYAGFAGANMLFIGLAVIFMPEPEYLLIETSSSILEVTLIGAVREAGVLILMLNVFIFALYKFYGYKEEK